MSVFVLCNADTDTWSIRAGAAIERAGSVAQFAQGDAAAIPIATRVVLASSAMPLATIAAVFEAPGARPCRKIAIVDEEGTAALPLFDLADMLVFSAAGLANLLGLERAPDDAAALAAVQILLKRPSQAAVVRFTGNAATAIWADRTLDVTGPEGGKDEGTFVRFGGAIAAAVDLGIGPEPALVMALAAAVSRPASRADR